MRRIRRRLAAALLMAGLSVAAGAARANLAVIGYQQPLASTWLNSLVQSTDLINDLRAFVGTTVPSSDSGVTGTVVDVLGEVAPGDGLGGKYYWNAGSTATDDGFNAVKPTVVIGAGRWVREPTSGGGGAGTVGAGTAGQIAQYPASGTAVGGASISGDASLAIGGAWTNLRINGVSYPASPSINTIPVVTSAGVVTYEAVPNAALANAATTVNGQNCALGGTCTITATAGTVTIGTTAVAGGTSPDILYNNGGVLGNEATLAASQEPAHTGDMTNSAGSLATAVGHVNGVSYPTSPSTNTAPIVTASNTITYEAVPNAALANSSTTVNGQNCALGGTCTITASAGTISVGVTAVAGGTSPDLLYNNAGTLGNEATLAASQEPAHTGDMTNSAGSLATTVGSIGGKAVSLGGNLTIGGAFATTLNVTAATNITLPTSGTLLTNALPSTDIFVGSSGGVATGVAPSGACTISNAGAFSCFGSSAGTLPATALSGTLAAAQEPAHTGDMTNSAGSLATTVGHVDGVSYPASPSTNTAPIVTASNTITYEAVPNAALANSSTTVNGQNCALGGTCTITASAGTISVGVTAVAGGTSPDLLYNNAGTLGNEATLAASQEPAHTGDMTNSAGSLATTVGHVDGVSYPASPSTNTVPVVTAANTTTYEQLPASALAAGAAVANLGFTPLNPANNGSDFASVPTALATIEGGAPTVVTATGAQAVTSGETNIDWNPATPAATTFTLPASPIAGEEHTFKDLISSGTFPMEIKGNTSPAQTIDGNAYIVLVYANDTRKIKYAGSNSWIIVH